MRSFTHLVPKSLEEAIEILAEHGEEAKLIAGGTALYLMMKEGAARPEYLVDIKNLQELKQLIYEKERGFRIGALVTHRTLELSERVEKEYSALWNAFHSIGNVRIRNVATVGGNLAYAEPWCSPPTVLTALNASIELSGPEGTRTVPAKDFIHGIYESDAAPVEVLTEVFVPQMPPNAQCIFYKSTTRSEDKPAAAVAVYVEWTEDREAYKETRIVIGAIGPRPYRCLEAERLLMGEPLDDRLIKKASIGALEGIEAIDDMYGPASYKKRVSGVLIRRALMELSRRLGGGAGGT